MPFPTHARVCKSAKQKEREQESRQKADEREGGRKVEREGGRAGTSNAHSAICSVAISTKGIKHKL